MSRRITRRRNAADRGSSTVEFSLVVAAMAAMILAVVLGVGRVVGSALYHGCTELSSQVAAGTGECVAPDAPGAGANGGPQDGRYDPPAAVDPAAHDAPADPSDGPTGDTPAPGPNDLGGGTDDM